MASTGIHSAQDEIRLALENEHNFELALRAALVSPESLATNFTQLVFWMSDLIVSFDNLGVEGDVLIDDLGHVFQKGFESNAPDYTAICEIVRLHDARRRSSQKGVPDDCVAPSATLDYLPLTLPSSPVPAPVEGPPPPPLATKPAVMLPGTITSAIRAPVATFKSYPTALHAHSRDTSANLSMKVTVTSVADSSDKIREGARQKALDGAGRGKSADAQTAQQGRMYEIEDATSKGASGLNSKSHQDVTWLPRMETDQVANGEDSYSGKDEMSHPLTWPTELDERSLSKKQPTIGIGISDFSEQVIPPTRMAFPEYDSDVEEEHGGDNQEDGGVGHDDVDDNRGTSNRETATKPKRGQTKKVKKPLPPDEEREYYPRPCPRCQENGLSCFLPRKRRASRRTCWYCEEVKSKCPFAANILMMSTTQAQDMLAEKVDTLSKSKEEASQEDIVALGEDGPGYPAKDELINDLIQSNTKLRDDVVLLTDKIVTLTQSYKAREQRLADLAKACIQRENSLVERLTAAMRTTVECAVDAALKRHYCKQPNYHSEVDTEDPQCQLDNEMAKYICFPNDGSEATAADGRCAFSVESQASRQVETIGALTMGSNVCLPDPLLSPSTQEVDPDVEQARGAEDQADRDLRTPGPMEMEAVMVAGPDIEHSPPPGQSAARAISNGKLNVCESTCSSSNMPSLYDRPLSPLSDIPEEEEVDVEVVAEGQEAAGAEAIVRPPSRRTRSFQKRKASPETANRPSPAKRAKGISTALKGRGSHKYK